MKKKLNTENITNELEGASLFFTRPASPLSDETALIEKQPSPVIESPAPVQPQISNESTEITKKPETIKQEQSKRRDTTTPRYHDTTVSRYHDTTIPHIHGVTIDTVRKAVKEFGKEAATHRFTEAEKKGVADLIYTYKNQGIKTSENEIARISINFVMEDFRVNGENSVLYKIIKALNE